MYLSQGHFHLLALSNIGLNTAQSNIGSIIRQNGELQSNAGFAIHILFADTGLTGDQDLHIVSIKIFAVYNLKSLPRRFS